MMSLIIINFGQAQTVITTFPYTISQPGEYIVSNANAYASNPTPGDQTWLISIHASNVTLDLNGITFLPRPFNNGSVAPDNNGILVEGGNVTVKNGRFNNFNSGFTFALYLLNSQDVTVSNITFYGATYSVLDNGGTNTVISDCSIASTDGVAAGAMGIYLYNCTGDTVKNNNISNQKSATAYGIYSTGSQGCLFKDNTVHYSGSPYGMVLSPADQYRGNSFLGFPAGSPIIYSGIHITE